MLTIDTAPLSGEADLPTRASATLLAVAAELDGGADRSRIAQTVREVARELRSDSIAETAAGTPVLTREAAQRQLSEAFRASESGFVGVIRCDVDRFAWIHDALGLAGADEVLRQIAGRLVAVCPPSSVVGPLGGDEFVIVLPSLRDALELDAVVKGLRDGFRTALTVNGREIFVVLSVGSSVTAREAAVATRELTAERIMRDAETAMRVVKQGRRAERIGVVGTDLLQLDADLHHALDRGEIVAHFQPQYDARTGTLTGYEALARWHHAERGALAPDRFIPLAEADGLIDRLFDTVLEQACRFAARAATDRLLMAVNVSAQQLTVAGLSARIEAVLAGYPDRGWSLTIEVTESGVIRDQDRALQELERIRDLGVGVSIDDFGSGYSSLAQLRDLPVTELKIDRSFVERDDATGRALLTAIITLANSLGLTVVAEGVETPSQLEMLRDLGCDRLQGMYLGRPLDPDRALEARSDISELSPPAR